MMNTIRFAAALVLFALCLAAVDDAAQQVTLEMRTDNGPYKKSTYSFRQATGDPAVHKNYVDLLLNKCGLLHISTVSGVESRICDLGKSSLKDAPDTAPADAKWYDECVKPVAGHVYLQEIKADKQTMTVKFLVDEVAEDKVKLTWVTVKPLAGPTPEARRGAAGTMGQCGGEHAAH